MIIQKQNCSKTNFRNFLLKFYVTNSNPRHNFPDGSIIGIRSDFPLLSAPVQFNQPSSVHLTKEILPTITVSNCDEELSNLNSQSDDQMKDVSIDGMLDRISHDLDYLLDRNRSGATTVTITADKPLVQDESKM